MTLFRRQFLASALALPAAAQPAPKRLKFIITGGHPGDPECGCAGTIARLADVGHEVVVFYLNRGEGFCGGAPLNTCAGIRTAEAQAACRILKARPMFGTQYDGRAVVGPAQYEEFGRILKAEEPDAVFTHWPIDRHRDHRAISMLALDAWLKSERKYAFYYYEVAEDTMMFKPDAHVDISAVEPRRRAACYAHASQRPEKWYPSQVEITRRRGADSGFAQAEGFLRHAESIGIALPG